MSGYRTLHRHRPSFPATTITTSSTTDQPIELPKSAPSSPSFPIWHVQFSPCVQTSPSRTSPTRPLRLLTASADGLVRAYLLIDKTVGVDGGGSLDATALKMRLTHVLLSSKQEYPPTTCATMGCAKLDVVRNYVGEDDSSGGEIVAAMNLDGRISVWTRDEQPSYADGGGGGAAAGEIEGEGGDEEVIRSKIEFGLEKASGTTLAIKPPQLGYRHQSQRDVLVAVGCLDGSVTLCALGVSIPSKEITAKECTPLEGGTVLERVGAGGALVTALVWHPSNDTFAVGRKDGTIDVYSAPSQDDYYGGSGGGGGGGSSYRRVHHVTSHTSLIRAVSFTSDGALLLSGSDSGDVHVHDIQRRHVASLVHIMTGAHKSWVVNIRSFWDGRRFATSGADRTVKVWDVGMSNTGSVHAFDTGHEGVVWGLDQGGGDGGRRLVSGGDEGLVQIYSCED